MAKIYVASSWRNIFQPAVVQNLREIGHEVYDFRNPPKRSGFAWADVCVMVLVYSPIRQEPELMYKLYDGITDDIQELKEMIAGTNRHCGGCDAFCECGLAGIESSNNACEYFDDESLMQLRNEK